MNCRPIGVLVMEDDGGQDEKLIAVPSDSLSHRYKNVHSYNDLPAITRDQVQHFFEHYKDLEPGKWVKIEHWGDVTEAKSYIEAALQRAAASETIGMSKAS